ncbi:hypothetical protein [Streptomyces flavidovirens]|uniref:hypothetical protein n=1 Tax=Streptomyces flavidovirens TaxID=67298 RepID=UPI000561D5B0|nr:hypothetical protein [Streptomyces flavidovirens]
MAEQKAAECETRRPVCANCGAEFAADRWKAAAAYPMPGRRWHPTLCDSYEGQAVEADQQADGELQEQDQVPDQKASGWFSRLRT